MKIAIACLIVVAVALNVLGQVLLKWRLLAGDAMPDNLGAKFSFLIQFMHDPWVLLAFTGVFGASVLWIMALSRVELSWPYPFMGLSFLMVLAVGVWLFDEILTWQKVIGVLLIAAGVVVSYSSGTCPEECPSETASTVSSAKHQDARSSKA